MMKSFIQTATLLTVGSWSGDQLRRLYCEKLYEQLQPSRRCNSSEQLPLRRWRLPDHQPLSNLHKHLLSLRLFISSLALLLLFACNTSTKQSGADDNATVSFSAFQQRFLDSFWKNNPAEAIYAGYNRYAEDLKIPDSASFINDVIFSKRWLDSLHSYNYNNLSSDDKINYNIISNRLQKNIWYIDTFKLQQWDPSQYNIGGECYYILIQNDVGLNAKLSTLSKHLQNAGAYFKAAAHNITNPTREYTQLAILQNERGLSVFGSSLADSIKASTLSQQEKVLLQKNIDSATSAIKSYVSFLKNMLADSAVHFRDFRIGRELYNQKFAYDLVVDITPEQLYTKSTSAKNEAHKKMYVIADSLWTKYCGALPRPTDSLQLIKAVIDKVALHHAPVKHLMDTARSLVHSLQSFIIKKNLFAYDTSYPLQVRVTPGYASGIAVASADFAPPYKQTAVTYFNIDDLTAIPPAKAESQLREYNNYTLQILTIHEAMPGHCLQGVYNSRNKTGMVKSVFQNGAMIEGWAVYAERMMIENGWGNNSPELMLMFYKWLLRECCNVIVDYDLQCNNMSQQNFIKLLVNEAFQEEAQVEEKYHRATVSQVQLCSYFAGSTAIRDLRNAYENKKGNAYSIKDFHERFLSYGSAPVKYISEMMMQ